MLDFFEKAKKEKSHEFMTSRKAGTFSQIATKIGLRPGSKLESDPRYYLVRHIVQQLKVEQDEDGKPKGLSYDLHFSEQPLTEIAKLFESAKKTVKETLHRYSPTNNGLEATMTAELDQLENKVLTKLEPEKKSKGSLPLPERKASVDYAKPLAKAHARSRSNVSKMQAFEMAIPEDGVIGRTDSMNNSKRDMKPGSLGEKQDIKRTDSGLGMVRPRLGSWRRKGSAVSVKEVKGKERPKSMPFSGSIPLGPF